MRAPVPLAAGAVAVASLALALAVDARASGFDVLGFGPAGMAEVGARAARADDGTSVFYSPGGLALGRGIRVELAPSYAGSALDAQGETLELTDPFGVAVAFDATIPFEAPLKDTIRFGFGGYFLPGEALRLIARPGDQPLYPYYDNRTQRLVAIPALAVKIADGVGVGVGLNILAGVTGPADVRAGASGAPEASIDVDTPTELAANVGLRFDPAPGIRTALVYRQRFAIEVRIPTTAEVGGIPISVNVGADEALFDPDVFILATSFDLGKRVAVELDASYSLWSAYDGPYLQVAAELPGFAIRTKVPEGLFRDVIGLRAAATARAVTFGPSELVLRGGVGLEPSILESTQQGRTNLLDGDKVFLGAGGTLVLREVLPRTLTIGLGGNAQLVSGYEQEKRTCASAPCPPSTVGGPDAGNPSVGITNPGYPKLEGGGVFWAASLGVGVQL